MSIKHWPEQERPRERLLAQGAKSLSDAELLAIFLRTGVKGQSAVALSRSLLKHFGSLAALLTSKREDFCQGHGLGSAKYAQLQAVMEMASRCFYENLKKTEPLSSPQATRDFLQSRLQHHDEEIFAVLYLNNRHQPLHFEKLFRGTIDAASVYPRVVVKNALQHNAAALIIAHNHPSGVAEPSAADCHITERIKNALALVDIRLLDHFIVGKGTLTSLAELGKM